MIMKFLSSSPSLLLVACVFLTSSHVGMVNARRGTPPPPTTTTETTTTTTTTTPPPPTTTTPPPKSGVEGDPHFKLFNGTWFDFHGECDLVLVSAPNFGKGLGLDIYVRTTIRYDYSFVEAASIRIGSDIFEVGSYGLYYVNGVETAELNSVIGEAYNGEGLGEQPATIGGCPVSYKEVNENSHLFRIDLGNDDSIVIKVWKDIVSVVLNLDGEVADDSTAATTTIEEFRGAKGLMGDFAVGLAAAAASAAAEGATTTTTSGSTMIGRDGTVIDDPIEFSKEWQVRSTEANLFLSPRYPQYPDECTMPGSQRVGRRRLVESSLTRQDAEDACAHLQDPTTREHCIFDVIAMEDLSYADTLE